jgi:outer membrane protein assembly factor BamB
MARRFPFLITMFALAVIPMIGAASDWSHWRGPKQNGVSADKNLPSKVDGNEIWRAPYGCRSTPLVFNDRVYIINYDSKRDKAGDDIAESIRERVMCLDAKTGKKIWQHTFPVFHTDIVTSRLGWTNLAADPATGNIYAHGTQGLFMCLDGKDGKVVWQRSMGEEFGRVSGYGGRITSPIVDEDLAILGMVNSSWGDQAKGGNRFVALNKRSGEVVWWSNPAPSKGTYYSAPVIATINKQRLLISGGADGSVFAIKVRTGEPVWHFVFSASPINSSPVVDGNYVYIGQGEENLDTNVQGRIICLDAGDIKDGKPRLVWKVDGIKARYASPIFHDGRLYMPDDNAKLYCFDGKTGTQLWKFSYGRNARGSPAFGDGKIYVGEVDSHVHILEPGPKKCKSLDSMFFPAVNGVANVEVNGSPAIADGRVYFATSDEVICIGRKDAIATPVSQPPVEKVVPGKITHLQIVPGEVAIHSGDSVTFKARAFDGDGNFVKEVKPDWSLPAPAPPPGVKANPPALKGAINADGKLTVDAKLPAQQSIVAASFEGITARARVRVAPKLPYFNPFDNYADGIAPGGWVNTQGKWVIKTIKTDKGFTKVLAKVNDKASPLITTDNGYITLPTASGYTIACDVFGTKVGNDLPDMGIVANRYTLSLAGNIQKLRIQSWDPVPRIDKTIQFNWQPNVWYRMKLTVEIADGKGMIRGKCWPRDQKEPAAWSVEVADSNPITEGSAALYGNVVGVQQNRPGTEIYYDNLAITPNK